MRQESKFTSKEEKQLAEGQQTQQDQVLEFATPELMLRHDARQTPVPPAIGQRLRESIKRDPPRPSTWWRKWLPSKG